MSRTMVSSAGANSLYGALSAKMHALIAEPLYEARVNARRFPMSIALYRLMGKRTR